MTTRSLGHSISPDNGKRCTGRGHGTKQARRRAPVEVRLDDESVALQISDLADDLAISQVRDRCEQAVCAPTFVIADLTALPDDARYQLLSLIAGLGRPYTVVVGEEANGHRFADVFEAALVSISNEGNVERCERSRRAAIEAASLMHPDALPIACSRIHDRLREVGVRGVLPQTLLKQAQALAGGDAAAKTGEGMAEQFLNQIRDLATAGAGVPGDQPPSDQPLLAYYRDEFYQYEGTVWRRLHDAELEASIAEFLQAAGQGTLVTRRFLGDVVANLKGMVLIRDGSESPPLWIEPRGASGQSPYVAFGNGLIDLDTAIADEPVLLFHTPQHFSTVVLPFDFDPTAECPLWEESVHGILQPQARPCGVAPQSPGDNRIAVLQEFMGYTLMPADMTHQKFLALVGAGANGKSTIAKVWVALLGSENVSHVPLDMFHGEFRLAQMEGKAANIVADMNRIDRLEEGLLKKLVSGDPVQVNRKFKSPISMRPTAKLIFATNELPPFTDRSDGIWRRMISMPFHRQFIGAADDLSRGERLLAELPGIFNWALAGARRLHAQGGFSSCSVCDRCRQQHRFHSDPVAQFVRERCARHLSSQVVCDALYAAYRTWCEESGYRPLAKNNLGKQILALPGVRRSREPRGKRRYMYLGITVGGAAAPTLRPTRP